MHHICNVIGVNSLERSKMVECGMSTIDDFIRQNDRTTERHNDRTTERQKEKTERLNRLNGGMAGLYLPTTYTYGRKAKIMFGTRKNSRTTLPTYHIYYRQRNRYVPERFMVHTDGHIRTTTTTTTTTTLNLLYIQADRACGTGFS